MSDSSISSDDSDWDSSWSCIRDFPDLPELTPDHSYQNSTSNWYSLEDHGKRESHYISEYYSREGSRDFSSSIKTVPGNSLESEKEETILDYLDSCNFNNENNNFFDSKIPNCKSQRLQHNAKLCIEYMEDDISRLMWNLEQQFQECVLTKDSKRQRNHGFSIEEVSEIDAVEQKKYKLRSYISILRYITSMIESCASIELQYAKEELEMTNLLRNNISETFMKLQKVNLTSESLKLECEQTNDSQKNNNQLKIRKSKRIQAKVLEEEINISQSSSPKIEIYDVHSISDESIKYCFCKQPVLDNMIRCESGDECIYGIWFHFLCLKIISEPQKTWYCPGCSKDEEYRALWSHIFLRESNKRLNEGNSNLITQGNEETVLTPLISSNSKNEKKKSSSKKERKRSKSIDNYPKKKHTRTSFFAKESDSLSLDISTEPNHLEEMKNDNLNSKDIKQDT